MSRVTSLGADVIVVVRHGLHMQRRRGTKPAETTGAVARGCPSLPDSPKNFHRSTALFTCFGAQMRYLFVVVTFASAFCIARRMSIIAPCRSHPR